MSGVAERSRSRPIRKEPAATFATTVVDSGPMQATSPASDHWRARTASGPRKKECRADARHAGRGGTHTDGDACGQRQGHGGQGHHDEDQRPRPTTMAAARGEDRISIRLEQAAAQRRVTGFVRNISRDEITHQVRIGQFEKLGKCGALVDACARWHSRRYRSSRKSSSFIPRRQRHASLRSSTSAVSSPSLCATRRADQCWRSTIIFLISAMALAGFRSFGQASVQFMMVWQR